MDADFKTWIIWKHLAEAAMWVAVSVAIILALAWTHRITPLWFFVIPAFVQMLDIASGMKEPK